MVIVLVVLIRTWEVEEIEHFEFDDNGTILEIVYGGIPSSDSAREWMQ